MQTLEAIEMNRPQARITQADVDKWCCEVRPFPLPDYMTPSGGTPLIDLGINTLLDAPPHMIVHVQRTAAQGGLQVVSPRQTPLTALMFRSRGGERQLGDHVVGSTADPSMEWPTIDGADFSQLLPDEPLPGPSVDRALKPKTRTEPITRAGRLLSDPVLACLVKGRAVIDVLRREDVAGGAAEMTEILAKAWGVGVKEIDDMDAFTLGIQGPLLRHAIKADEVYPVCHAPIHTRRCVSTGVNEVTRELLPEESAMDWRRMRVHCESVFILACAIEGLPIKNMRCFPPPGDPAARTDRSGVMVFLPAPASAWTFSSDTFSIYPTATLTYKSSLQIPREVLEALTRYTSLVRPLSYAMSVGHRAATRRTSAARVDMPLGETISEAYRMMSRSIMVGSARGRTAAATVRNLIYKAVESSPMSCRMRIARYLSIAPTECSVHLGSPVVPDIVVDKIANKFVEIGELIRMHVVAEAARRGATAEEWWADIVSQAPEGYKMLTEGTRGWARIAMWLIFRAPTDKWHKLVKAVNYGALREAERMSVGAVALPAEKGSKDRLLAAARHAARGITKAYASYYIGVADVGLAIADAAEQMGKGRTADTLREAAYLWTLRARVFRGTNVNPIAKEEPTPSRNHQRVSANPVDLILAPAPYRAFEAYTKHIVDSTVIPPAIKRHFSGYKEKVVSGAFSTLSCPILPAKNSLLTTYLLTPAVLGQKMEKAWTELTIDLRTVASIYGETERAPVPQVTSEEVMRPMELDLGEFPKRDLKYDYFAALADMDEDEVEWMEEMLERIPDYEAEVVTTMMFTGVEHLREVMLAYEHEYVTKPRKTGEYVR